jgi:hypothetical protein
MRFGQQSVALAACRKSRSEGRRGLPPPRCFVPGARRRAALRRESLMSSGRHLRPSFVSLITSRPFALPRRFHLRPTSSRSRLASSAMPPTTRSSRSRGAAEQLAEQPAPKRSKRGLAAAPAKAVEKQKVQVSSSHSLCCRDGHYCCKASAGRGCADRRRSTLSSPPPSAAPASLWPAHSPR